MANTNKNNKESTVKTPNNIDDFSSLFDEYTKDLTDKEKLYCELYILKYKHRGMAYCEAFDMTDMLQAQKQAYKLLNGKKGEKVHAYMRALNNQLTKDLYITFEDTVRLQWESAKESAMSDRVDLNGITKTMESIRDALGMNGSSATEDAVKAIANVFANVKAVAKEDNKDGTN